MTANSLPIITITPAAARALAEAREAESDALHLTVTTSFEHDLSLGPSAEAERDDAVRAVRVQVAGITIVLDPESARRADGLVIDYVTTPSGAGFQIDNPNAPPRVQQLSPRELKAMLDRGERLELFDVRTLAEQDAAVLPGARLFDRETQAYLDGLDRGTLLVFQCHHGGRSQAAAERAVAAGFRRVYNLRGGIDAWSREVDPTVPRY
jgi:monothiol glutaredoxin